MVQHKVGIICILFVFAHNVFIQFVLFNHIHPSTGNTVFTYLDILVCHLELHRQLYAFVYPHETKLTPPLSWIATDDSTSNAPSFGPLVFLSILETLGNTTTTSRFEVMRCSSLFSLHLELVLAPIISSRIPPIKANLLWKLFDQINKGKEKPRKKKAQLG